MQRITVLLAAAAIGLALAACGASDQSVVTVTAPAEPTTETVAEPVTETIVETETETVAVTVEAAPEEDSEPEASGSFPEGYPKRVPLSDVPDPPRSFLREGTYAIAIAPGVWTDDNPGTTVLEDALYGGHYGFCSQIEVYEREYGLEAGGSCW